MNTWHQFDGPDPLPPERRDVLVGIAPAGDEHRASIAVGYLRYAAGDIDCPFFVVPGFGRPFIVTHWCDMLGDDFVLPPGQEELRAKRSTATRR